MAKSTNCCSKGEARKMSAAKKSMPGGAKASSKKK